MCIEAVVWNLLHLGESWRCKKGLERLLHIGRFGSRHRFSLSRQSFLVLCRDSRFCVVIGFGMSRVFLGHNRVFLVATVLFLFLFSVATGVPYVSQQCFVFCCDNVVTEVPLLPSRWSRQEVLVATQLG